jgi:hypothetical protein
MVRNMTCYELYMRFVDEVVTEFLTRSSFLCLRVCVCVYVLSLK